MDRYLPFKKLIRLLIQEVAEDLETQVMELQGIVGAVEDGIWGPETQRMWTQYVMDIDPDVEGASLEDLTDQWGWHASDISAVNGQPRSYSPNVKGALDFLYDIDVGAGRPRSSNPTPKTSSSASSESLEAGSRRVCILGDSHVASQFGISLEKKLKDEGFYVKRFGVGGSTGPSWLSGNTFSKTPKTLGEVEDGGPYDIAVICLGTNDGANAHVVTQDPGRLASMAQVSAAKIREVSDSVGAPITFWVGPPGMTGKSENPHYQPEAMDHVYNAVTPLFPDGTFDSRHIDTGLGDHVHVYGGVADKWADEVSRFIKESVK